MIIETYGVLIRAHQYSKYFQWMKCRQSQLTEAFPKL